MFAHNCADFFQTSRSSNRLLAIYYSPLIQHIWRSQQSYHIFSLPFTLYPFFFCLTFYWCLCLKLLYFMQGIKKNIFKYKIDHINSPNIDQICSHKALLWFPLIEKIIKENLILLIFSKIIPIINIISNLKEWAQG